MSYEESVGFEKKLAYHTAPTLLGIKSANLISIGKDEFNIYESVELFNSKAKNKKIKILCSCKNRKLIFVYNEKMLESEIREKERMTMLEKFGYGRELSLGMMLEKLGERLEKSKEFPHEIGLFLGYPTEDVKGFIENKGEMFKICGYWKVYDDEEKANKIFSNYNKCRKFLCNKLEQGIDIYSALKLN